MKISVLSKHIFMVEGVRNTYIISTFDKVSITPVYNNNPDGLPLCIVNTLEDAIRFIDTVDKAVNYDV